MIHLSFIFKFLLGLCLDVYLILSIDSEILDNFLESCSNESWFSHISLLFKTPSTNSQISSSTGPLLDVKVIEKLSVLLQKLSKIKYIIN